jgi:hypothetical protein
LHGDIALEKMRRGLLEEITDAARSKDSRVILLKGSEEDLTGHAAEYLRQCFDELSAAPEGHFEELAAGSMKRLSRHPGSLRYLALKLSLSAASEDEQGRRLIESFVCAAEGGDSRAQFLLFELLDMQTENYFKR